MMSLPVPDVIKKQLKQPYKRLAGWKVGKHVNEKEYSQENTFRLKHFN